jgi:hypothetical protein
MNKIIIILTILLTWGCVSSDKPPEIINSDNKSHSEKSAYNFKLVVSNPGLTDPAQDTRVYYKVFINKSEEGRTTTGLDSQDLIYEANLQNNRHLIQIEKWILDPRAEKYIKLNNIDQPKPNYTYFTASSDKRTIVRFTIKKEGASVDISQDDD